MQRNGEVLALTGIRGVAAICVVFCHAGTAAVRANADTASYFPGQPFVDLFFVLSGFVLAYVYLRRDKIDWYDFTIARFARIYPLHVATAVFMACAAVGVGLMSGKGIPDWINFSQALREMTLTTAMPFIGSLKIWNFPSWSISVEWWAYFLVFPLAVEAARRLHLPLSATLAGVALVALCVALYLLPPDAMPTRGWPAFTRAAVGLAAGVVTFQVASLPNAPLIPARVTDVAAIALFFALFLARPVTGSQAWFSIPLFPLLIYALVRSDNPGFVQRFLETRVVLFLGAISYSVYLTHSIALNIVEETLAKFQWFDGLAMWSFAILALTLAISVPSYYLLELPAKSAIRRASGRDRAAPAE